MKCNQYIIKLDGYQWGDVDYQYALLWAKPWVHAGTIQDTMDEAIVWYHKCDHEDDEVVYLK